jgi:type 1 glutamine amidotransferase
MSDWQTIAQEQAETIEALAGLCSSVIKLLAMHTDASREEREFQSIIGGAHD